MRGAGIIYKLPDGRKVIVYKEQPAAKCRDMKESIMFLHLIDDNNNVIYENNKPKILIKKSKEFNELIYNSSVIGFVD